MPRKQQQKPAFDAGAILETLARIRESIPEKYRVPVPPRGDQAPQSLLPAMLLDAATVEDFEMEAVQEGVESVLAELTASLDNARRLALEKALEIYYTAEELARQPEHADLLPQVEAMRAAYERDYGRPIPPRKA